MISSLLAMLVKASQIKIHCHVDVIVIINLNVNLFVKYILCLQKKLGFLTCSVQDNE